LAVDRVTLPVLEGGKVASFPLFYRLRVSERRVSVIYTYLAAAVSTIRLDGQVCMGALRWRVVSLVSDSPESLGKYSFRRNFRTLLALPDGEPNDHPKC
jgi:hypothetical protein